MKNEILLKLPKLSKIKILNDYFKGRKMRLSKFSDFSFRALIYLAENTESLNTIETMANKLNISQNHLKKIIHKLSKGNFIQSFKGRDGGIKIAKSPDDILLSDVLLYTEVNTDFVECLKHNIEHTSCPYYSTCNLKTIIHRAKDAFVQEFQKYSLRDIMLDSMESNLESKKSKKDMM